MYDRLQARPEGHAVGAGGFLPDDGAAGAGGAAQVAELERSPGQGLAGDAVRFVHHDSVEGDILKGQRFAFPALNVDLLGGGLLPVVVLLEPYQIWNFAPSMGLPVMLSTLWMVRVGFL